MRHDGFIPWDDDTDVLMPRADYEKLLKLTPPKNTFLVKHTDDQSVWPFSKLCLSGTHFNEVFMGPRSPQKYGVFIDIFPVDYAPSNRSLALLKHRLSRNIILRLFHIAHVCDYATPENKIKALMKPFVSSILRTIPSSTYRNLLTKISKNQIFCTRNKLVEYFYPKLVHLDSSWFSDVKKLSFNGTEFKVPSNWEAVLSATYGENWRTPIKREQERHGIAYIEDNQTIEDIIAKLNRGD